MKAGLEIASPIGWRVRNRDISIRRLSTVANADCIYVVQDGQIAESGTKDELCAQNGLFARMRQEYQASVQWKVAKEG